MWGMINVAVCAHCPTLETVRLFGTFTSVLKDAKVVRTIDERKVDGLFPFEEEDLATRYPDVAWLSCPMFISKPVSD